MVALVTVLLAFFLRLQHYAWSLRPIAKPYRSIHPRYSFSRLASIHNNDHQPDEEAQVLKERAQQVRLQAETMERELVASKLESLQNLLERQSELSAVEQQDIQDKIDRLKNYNDPPTKQQQNKTVVPEKNKRQRATVSQTVLPFMMDNEELDQFYSELDISENLNSTNDEYVGNLQEEDTRALEQLEVLVAEIEDIFNGTLSEELDDDFWSAFKELKGSISGSLAGNITEDDLELIKGVTDFANGVLKFTGWNVSNWKNILKDEVVVAKEAVKEDPLYFERIEMMNAVLPQSFLASRDHRLKRSEAKDFVKQVMLPIDSVFKMKSRDPVRLGSSFILQGTSTVDNGDCLIEQIDKQLVESGLQEKFQCYYIGDVSSLADLDEVQMADQIQSGEASEFALGNLENFVDPSILVTAKNVELAPTTKPAARSFMSLLAIASTTMFASSCYDQEAIVFSSPIIFGIIGLQLLHELGHFTAASLNKIEIAFPFLLFPSPSTGLLHVHTAIQSPPKNNKALFDFAISGPLLGTIASWGTLLLGLQLTADAKSSEVPLLPHVPLEFLQLSTVTSSTIESFLGTDVLLSLDPLSEKVAVHPLVIAAHVGIMVNALSLLPSMRTTDGGRMLEALSKKVDLIAVILQGLTFCFLWIQGFRGWDASKSLLLYTFLLNVIQPNTEVPCRNSVDPAEGLLRTGLFVCTTIWAFVALSPSF